MEEKQVLIAFGTRYGTTTEIVDKIKDELVKNNTSVTVVNLGNLKSKNYPSPKNYQAVLVGTGMKVNSWTKDVKKFIDLYKEDLSKEENTFAMFTCGAFAIGEPEKAKNDLIKKLEEEYFISPDLAEAFAGVLDFSDESNVGFLGKKILKVAAKGMQNEQNIEIDTEGRNDFRNWEKINSFASKLMNIL